MIVKLVQPKTASEETKKVLDNWKVRGMHCHFRYYIFLYYNIIIIYNNKLNSFPSGFLPAALCDEWLIPPMAKIVGAQEDEICLMNGLRKIFLVLNSHWPMKSDKGYQFWKIVKVLTFICY